MKIFWCYGVLYNILCGLNISTAVFTVPPTLTEVSEATLSEDGKLNFTQLVVKYGQTVEQYDVVTEDGYILTVFRIPGKKPPVLLFHGIIDSCDTFLIRGNISLVITLARDGYEVWVGNNRGNLYGRRHVSLNPDTDKKFWQYSFHEIGYYDLAATIDFVRLKTGVETISTVGHSQGTSAHFVLTSLRPEYNARIKVFIALAPIAYLNEVGPPLSLLLLAGPGLALFLKSAGIEEILQDRKAVSDLIKFICSKGLLSYAICGYLVVFPTAGYDPEGLESEFLTGVAPGHYPRATSRQCFEHYDQVYLRGTFAQYDYGKIKNIAKYGSFFPPEYNLSAVTVKVALFIGAADELSKIKDVELLNSSLPHVVYYKLMEPKQWNHLDFVWGLDMPKYLYPDLFALLEKYN